MGELLVTIPHPPFRADADMTAAPTLAEIDLPNPEPQADTPGLPRAAAGVAAAALATAALAACASAAAATPAAALGRPGVSAWGSG
ncbi:MAG: hypothetical protein J7598_23765, partial [Mitsuaria chitosanitabida]|nr:hypothetical protein [Roseateles chitosanitabidus]